MIDVNHLQGHVMAHFIKESDDDQSAPPFPFICLLVSGGNSQIVKVNEIIQPVDEWVEAYDRLYPFYVDMYQHLDGDLKRLKEVMEI